MKNDPHNENLEQAKKVRRKYRPILEDLRIKSTCGEKGAPVEYIRQITNYYQALKDLGYRTTSENEPGRVGRLVAITQEWIDAELAKETEVQRLMRQFRKEPNPDLVKQIISKMAEEL